MKSIPVANFIKLFGHHLQCSQLIAFSYDYSYAIREGCLLSQKSFMKSTLVDNFIKLFGHNLLTMILGVLP
jgi:hypothetical protein